ncbi:HAD-IC family P-type ATPase, partial [candidate division GN15 bacterium]|nr:HAD-IC family P-type ATPase [candidate division GN15 bacterium]
HPVGQAIVRHMKNRQISPAVVKNMENQPGFGVVAECDGRKIVVGNRSLMEKEEVNFGPSLLVGEQEMAKGRTVVFAAMDGQVIGLISLADQVRPEARDVILSLKERMSKVTMLSGDNRKTASGVARTLGMEDFEAEIKPHQKQILVDSYRRAGYNVAMIGDGVNDAPALAAADVGVAVGSGTDVAIEAADVVLVRSDLTTVTRMFNLAQQTLRVIKQNLFWAFAYNVIAIPIAAGALYPVMGLTLSPMIAALAMSLSSVFVVTNSLRLNRMDM